MTPLRWPSAWVDPALLGLLQGTPFDCLVAGADAPSPILQRAREAGLATVAIGHEPESVLTLADCVWPAIAAPAGGAEASGPTANPWIDSNGWLLRLAKMRSPQKTPWLTFTPPAAPRVVLLESYLRAIADTGTWGGTWVVSLDAGLQSGLARGDTKALASWKTIAAAVAFFKQHREWSALEPLGVVGVVSDFAGPNQTTSQEILNLMGRRNLAYRIVERSAAATASLAGFQSLVYVDEGAPSAPLRRRLLTFVERGGLLLVGPAWERLEGTPGGMNHPRVEVRRLGKGRLAVCKTDSPDPFLIARDVHMLVGRTYDVARFFNLSAFLSYCTASPGRTQELVQIVSFAIRFPNDLATVWVPGKYSSARLWNLGSETSVAIDMVAENGGTSLLLPPVPVYAGIELFRKPG